MKYVIDKIIDNIAVLENLNDNSKIEIDIKNLPKNIRDGSIVLFDNGKYILDLNLEDERRRLLKNRLNRLVGKSDEQIR